MRDNVIYNQADNEVYIKTNGDKTVIICNTEKQLEEVIDRMCNNYIFIEYEEWDEGDDKKYVLTFQVGENVELIYN